MEPEVSILHSHVPINLSLPWASSNYSIAPHSKSRSSILILYFQLSMGHPSGLFLSGFLMLTCKSLCLVTTFFFQTKPFLVLHITIFTHWTIPSLPQVIKDYTFPYSYAALTMVYDSLTQPPFLNLVYRLIHSLVKICAWKQIKLIGSDRQIATENNQKTKKIKPVKLHKSLFFFL